MPELPEVETIRKQISSSFPMKVNNVEFSKVSQRIVKSKEFNPKEFVIYNTQRIGKVIIFNIGNKFTIISGLGMSGSWRISKNKVSEKHTHIQFTGFDKNNQEIHLAYVDPRRFGSIHFLKKENQKNWLKRLGPDIASADFNLKYLQSIQKHHSHKILKPFLLDQKYFAGIGNYMASEICARANVLPTRKFGDLKINELKAILKSTKVLLDNSIKTGGTTFSGGYTDAYGNKGEGVKNLVVFHQTHCGLCGQFVQKIVQSQRSTYYCQSCQK
ncbi:MAG: Fpg/Nei family DNA glycosylase [Halobacteriovoraceae bacterium]|nr:Fpg/Nei family DNA glycosylase [Halobacteriovoraceae bacterium]